MPAGAAPSPRPWAYDALLDPCPGAGPVRPGRGGEGAGADRGLRRACAGGAWRKRRKGGVAAGARGGDAGDRRGAEPTLAALEAALDVARGVAPQVVVGLGGGAALDLAKALAALIPAPGGPMDHLEVVGRGLPLAAAPLPFVALPTTAGTGAEATKNAVIGLPDHRRKVSLRDDRMLARLAIVDPALTDGCPRGVTLACGLDAITQVIEPSCRRRPRPSPMRWPGLPSGGPARAGGADAGRGPRRPRCHGLGQPVGRAGAGQCGAWRGAWPGGGDRRPHPGGAWRDLRRAAGPGAAAEPRPGGGRHGGPAGRRLCRDRGRAGRPPGPRARDTAGLGARGGPAGAGGARHSPGRSCFHRGGGAGGHPR